MMQQSVVDELVRPAVESGEVAGAVVGILEEGAARVYGYGKARAGPEAPNGSTIFEIGSVTKVFTGLLLAELAERGLVGLDEPVSRLLHLEVTRERPKLGREITLVDLATHTSGLPCWPDNLGPYGPDGQFARYSLQQLYEYLSARSLARKPGAMFEYSNLGMGLLGEALSRRASSSYDSLVKSLLCEPLGLRDTSVVVTDAQRLAQGPNFVFASLEGAGALHSTANDLLRFLAANLDPPPALAAAIKLSHGPRPLGWMVQPDGQTYYHDGATAGYTSWMSFHRARRTAMVVLQNRGQSP